MPRPPHSSKRYCRSATQREIELIDRLVFSDFLDSAEREKEYRPSLFKLTIKRTELCAYEDVYYCTYKFHVHAEDSASLIEGSTDKRRITSEAIAFYSSKIPFDAVNDGGGIMLIIVLQWETNDGEYIHRLLGTHDHALFFPTTTDEEEEDSGGKKKLQQDLKGTLALVINGLGITSPKENPWVTSQLVSSIISVHDNNKESSKSYEGWKPVMVKIAIERQEVEGAGLEYRTDKVRWGVREMKRFFRGLVLVKIEKFMDMGQEDGDDNSCPICLRGFQAKHELVRMPSCCHIYHPNCILEWLVKTRSNCPMCRCRVHKFLNYRWRRSYKFLLLK